jgi:hydroxyethylthiazole kinase
MTRVTGMGCTATALIGAWTAVVPNPLEAVVHALTVMGIAGEIAATRARGPGSLQLELLDALYGLDAETVAARARVTVERG